MDDKSFEERELVPGTNIPKPRYREYYESDEDYVAYLKDYYSKYFPEIGKESVEVKNASEINESNYPKPIDEHKVDDDILSFDLNVVMKMNFHSYHLIQVPFHKKKKKKISKLTKFNRN